MSSMRAAAARGSMPADRPAAARRAAAHAGPRSRRRKQLNVLGSHLETSASSIQAVASSISLRSTYSADAPHELPVAIASRLTASRLAAPSSTCARVSHTASRRRAPQKITS